MDRPPSASQLPEILDYARQGARRIYVGKKPYVKRISQEEINRIIVDETLKFQMVVRLKGGDPFMFGRGGEEIEELIKNNIEVFYIVAGSDQYSVVYIPVGQWYSCGFRYSY